MLRSILHCDMNNFYASVECMLDPALKKYPIAVCGSVEERHGIVLAKNYKAKAFDVKTGDAVWQAKQKCKDLVVVPPHYEEYIKYSKLARSVYERYTDQVEPYGMDECWLDISGTESLFGSPEKVANEIRETMKFELGLTISVGVSFNKIFAKLGSDMKKPDAVTVIPKDTFKEKIWGLPAADLLGVGRATQRVLDSYSNTCGYEWKAVVKARVKGGMCPVCAERAVLQGYNDLGTTDPHLLSEWDYEKNSKWTPSNVSRNSMKVVWWKCGAGHSYRAKITDRTIEQKGCPQCEAEFQQALPQMLIMMYGAQNGITVKSNSDSELGMRLVAYLPELHCAVDIAGATVTEKREQSVKAHICQSNRLGYYLIKRTADASQMAAEIKTLFIRNHIYLHTDSEKDVQVLRERFLEWKNRNACKLNGKY